MRYGFHDVNRFINDPTMPASGILTVKQYVTAVKKGDPAEGITPLDVAGNLDRLAGRALKGACALRNSGIRSKELNGTVTDIESMSHLGRYYAAKIRGAVALQMSRSTGEKSHQQRAVEQLEGAVEHWKAYATAASSHYKPQLLARTRKLDWQQILKDVQRDVAIARGEVKD